MSFSLVQSHCLVLHNFHKEMAKKVVATLKKEGGVKYAKIIKAVKSPITGAYTFKEEIILQDDVMSALKG
jgi:Domain of unknown function (DUF4295)